jgi:hypothetical protein
MYIIRRSLDLATEATIPPLDFAAAEAFAPASNTLTIGGLQSADEIEMQNTFWTATSTFGTAHSAQLTGPGPWTLHAVPANKMITGDLHELFVDAFQAGPSQVIGRSYVVYYGAPADRNDALGPGLSTPSLNVVAVAPYARVRGLLASQPEYNTSARFGYFQSSSTSSRTVIVGVSAAYFAATPTTWDMLIPDFTGTTGFQPVWMLAPNAPTNFFAEAFSGRTELLFGALPSLGDEVKLAYRVGQTSTTQLLRAPLAHARSRLPQYLRR